jgi:hypothetical protein
MGLERALYYKDLPHILKSLFLNDVKLSKASKSFVGFIAKEKYD